VRSIGASTYLGFLSGCFGAYCALVLTARLPTCTARGDIEEERMSFMATQLEKLATAPGVLQAIGDAEVAGTTAAALLTTGTTSAAAEAVYTVAAR